jgi:DNA end-binding protein Ku
VRPPLPKDMLALAEHILESKAATFDPTLFHDRYEEAVVAMLNEKRAGMPVSKEHGSDGGVASKHRKRPNAAGSGSG